MSDNTFLAVFVSVIFLSIAVPSTITKYFEHVETMAKIQHMSGVTNSYSTTNK